METVTDIGDGDRLMDDADERRAQLSIGVGRLNSVLLALEDVHNSVMVRTAEEIKSINYNLLEIAMEISAKNMELT